MTLDDFSGHFTLNFVFTTTGLASETVNQDEPVLLAANSAGSLVPGSIRFCVRPIADKTYITRQIAEIGKYYLQA